MTATLKETDLGGLKEVSQVAGEENFILQRIFFPFTTGPVHGTPRLQGVQHLEHTQM